MGAFILTQLSDQRVEDHVIPAEHRLVGGDDLEAVRSAEQVLTRQAQLAHPVAQERAERGALAVVGRASQEEVLFPT